MFTSTQGYLFFRVAPFYGMPHIKGGLRDTETTCTTQSQKKGLRNKQDTRHFHLLRKNCSFSEEKIIANYNPSVIKQAKKRFPVRRYIRCYINESVLIKTMLFFCPWHSNPSRVVSVHRCRPAPALVKSEVPRPARLIILSKFLVDLSKSQVLPK